MIGFNGGLIGAARETSASQSLPGVWTPREQLKAKRAGIWPTAPVPGDPFPPAYRSLIDNFASTKYFVDATTGSDSNAGTSFATAFATVDKAVTTASSGNMIVVYPGTYNTGFSIDSYSDAVFHDQGKALTVVCAAGQVKLQRSTSSSKRDFACLGVANAGTSLYGAIIERNNGGRTANYTVAMLRITRGSVYNCVLREVGSNGYFSLIYDNSNGYWKLDGCLVLGNTWTANYTGGGIADFINSASNNASVAITGSMSNTAVGKTINSDWSVDSASYGVYSGTYGWIQTTFTYP